jgi:branched-subunit amino acid transport protein
MTWLAIGVLAAISFALKAVGPVIVGDRALDPRAAELVALLPVPMLTALIVVGTFADGQSLQIDERLPAVAVAGVCVLRRLPFLVVICAAAATAAALRAL